MAGPLRQPIDVAALTRFLTQQLPDFKRPLTVKQFGYGQSNPTYQLIFADGKKLVLRKKPPGKLLSSTAHQVEREYRILYALQATNVPVPKTYGLCQDASVLGTPFYIMEYLDGRIFEDPAFPGLSAQQRNEMWHEAIRTLAKLHQVKAADVGLSTYGKPSGFYARQLKTLSSVSSAQSVIKDVETGHVVGPLPRFQDTVTFFSDCRAQPDDRSSLVHGDYKIDNLVYHKTEPRIIGILDWEMSTIGHPLSDLSNLLSPYCFAEYCKEQALSAYINEALKTLGRRAGIPSEAQCMSWYCEHSGWDPSQDLAWGQAFAVFRNAVIIQGIAARYAQRQASSAKAKEVGSLMAPMGRFTGALVERCQDVRVTRELPKL